MTNAWIAATIVAVIAGVVGFFVVMRGAAFPAHAIPNGAFAGAAGAALVGVPALLGLGVFAVLAALGIGWLGRRGRNDVVTALALVTMLALGAAFLSHTTEYSSEVFSLLFGELLGVSASDLGPIAGLALACAAGVALMYRPLMLSSAVPEMAQARGVRTHRLEMAFLVVLALSTAMTVPVVGALLIFTLMIGPPAAARAVTARPGIAMSLSVAAALATVWLAIASSYWTNWPVGFFVGIYGAAVFGLGRGWAAGWAAWTARTGRAGREARPAVAPAG
jgi:zinc/manganese transport system permease protein